MTPRAGASCTFRSNYLASSYSAGVRAKLVPLRGREEMPITTSASVQRSLLRRKTGRPMIDFESTVTKSLPIAANCPDFWQAHCQCVLRSPLFPAIKKVFRKPRIPVRDLRDVATRTLHPRNVECTGVTSASITFTDHEVTGAYPPRAEGLLALSLATARSALRSSRCVARTRMLLSSAQTPAYEAEALGGEGSVRGYEAGELGTGRGAVLGSVELIFSAPTQANASSLPVALALFADGALRTGRADARGGVGACAGGAAGYGVRYGPVRVDVAYAAKGGHKVHIGLALDD